MNKVVIVLLIVFISGLNAESETHDGFYLRFQTGVGYGQANYDKFVEIYGVAGIFTMHIGGAITEDLILFGKFSSASLSNPSINFLGIQGITEQTTYSVNTLGAGITYYMPFNFFLTGSMDISVADLEVEEYYKGSSDPGFGMELSIGKEWFVSDNWGLGLALYSHFSKMVDKDDENDTEYELGNVFIGLMFSATYN